MSTQPSFRRRYFSDPMFRVFKKMLPPLSVTEREAMEAGSVWWEGELFAGKPNWRTLLHYPKPQFSKEEQSFIDNQLETLLGMVDDFDIVQQRKDLPENVWKYLKEERFFSLTIPKMYGGLDFSAYANSTIVARIATRSLTVAVTVMVPNSLGPAELLNHYGTKQQKADWLPRLACGEAIPCFALTGPEVGSDASAMPDKGIVCMGKHQGEDVLGIRVTWDKRYITLAPVATVLGLAFKLEDPDGLLGSQVDIGITCALIPTDTAGVNIGKRHYSVGLAFMNGPTTGTDVFIPMDWVIGGKAYVGKGWGMLVECLSAGRGISLPALGAAIGHLSTRTTGAYAYVRKQFGLPIGKFEGVAESLGRIGAYTYMLEATRLLTTTSLDMKEKPGIVTAISKYHMTELARTILNDAMDVHAGRAIQLGPQNYLAHPYFGMPVAITVEGANILTRNLIIFGQGAIRCHPFIVKEMESAANRDVNKGAEEFDVLLKKHICFTTQNVLMSFFNAFTCSRFNSSPVSDETSRYYRHLSRMSRALSVIADIAMLTLGSELKRREMLSARLGDVLSNLYLASAVLKRYEDEERQQTDLPFVHYALQFCLHRCARAFDEALNNFPRFGIGRMLRVFLFPIGMHYKPPSDKLALQIANLLMTRGSHRERLTSLCYVGDKAGDPVAILERAFEAMQAIKPLEKKMDIAAKKDLIPAKGSLTMRLDAAFASNVLTEKEVKQIKEADELRRMAIQVDDFDPAWFTTKNVATPTKRKGKSAK